MSEGFRVDFGDLNSASRQLTSLSDGVRDGTSGCFAPGLPKVGHAQLAGTIIAAHGRWRAAASGWADHVESLGTRLSDAASTYAEADQAAEDTLDRLLT